jgi:hypothetical protein
VEGEREVAWKGRLVDGVSEEGALWVPFLFGVRGKSGGRVAEGA